MKCFQLLGISLYLSADFTCRFTNSSVALPTHTIYSVYLYSTPSRNLLRGALSPATTKEKCLKKLGGSRHIAPGQQAQRKRKFIPSGGANHRESSTQFKRRVGPRNQELTMSPRTKSSAGSCDITVRLYRLQVLVTLWKGQTEKLELQLLTRAILACGSNIGNVLD